MEPSAVAIVPAAGAGDRMGTDAPKAFLTLGSGPILALAALAVCACPAISALVVAVPDGWQERAELALGHQRVRSTIVLGGPSRQASVRAALDAIPAGPDIVVVHDAARPFASADVFGRVLDAIADGAEAAVPVVPVLDTVVRVRADALAGTEPRDELSLAQTPQAFRIGTLREAHGKAEASGLSFTDDASMVRWAGFEVRAVPGDPANRKITTPADLAEARRRIGADA